MLISCSSYHFQFLLISVQTAPPTIAVNMLGVKRHRTTVCARMDFPGMESTAQVTYHSPKGVITRGKFSL